jgi:hypothetical protein
VVRAARTALALYLVAGAAITLGPRPAQLFETGLRAAGRLFDGSLPEGAIEAGANVVLFLPIGFLSCVAFPRVRRGLLWACCTAASAAVELVQALVPGREVTARDVAMNSLGAALGVALAWAVIWALGRRPRARASQQPASSDARPAPDDGTRA